MAVYNSGTCLVNLTSFSKGEITIRSCNLGKNVHMDAA